MRFLKPFSMLYDKTLIWSSHGKAPYYLAGVSFAESSFFPIPPDVMLVSMGLAKPNRAWNFALIATIFSVLGGIFGYCIGFYGIELLQHYWGAFTNPESWYYQVSQWFEHKGIWILVLAAFTPIPYKLFTIAAGAMQMAILPFVFASIIGRGMRFFLVSAILYFVGDVIATRMRAYVDAIGWTMLATIVVVYCLFKWVF